MRFQHLEIPAFGPFTDFRQEFSRDPSDFHVIYGPNEAGKSSLLRAIRDLLYGIPAQTSDAFQHEYRQMRIGCQVQNRRGQELQFFRRKGNRNTLTTADGQALPDTALDPYLDSVDRSFFTTMFGLDADQLRSGALALLQGHGDLGKSLFSASLAGTPVHRILDDLQARSDRLFRGGARTSVTIRPAVEQYRNARSLVKSTAARYEHWNEARQKLQQAEQQCRDLQTQLSELRVRRDWILRCLDALPSLALLDEAEQRLRNQPELPQVAPTFAHDVAQVLQDRQHLAEKIELHARRIERHRQELTPDEQLELILQLESSIESVHARLKEFRQAQSALMTLISRQDALQRTIHEANLRLGVAEPSSPEQLPRISLVHEAEVQQAERSLREVRTSYRECEKQLAENLQDIHVQQKLLDATECRDASRIQAILIETEAAADIARRWNSLELARSRATAAVQDQYQRLALAPLELQTAYQLPVPAAGAIRNHEREQERLAGELNAVEAEIRKHDQEIRRHSRDLKRLDSEGTLPSIDSLQEARRQRDAIWDELQQSARRPGNQRSDEYRAAVVRADAIADQLYQNATDVAKAEDLKRRLQDLEEERAGICTSRESIRQQQADWQHRWSQLWQDCHIIPGSPSEMIDWRELWVSFQAAYTAWQESIRDCDDAQRKIRDAEMLLREITGLPGDAGLLVLREQAARLNADASAAEGRRRTLCDAIGSLEIRREQLQSQMPGLVDALARAETDWQALCRRMGFPEQLDADLCHQLLSRRRDLWDNQEQLRQLQDEANRLQLLIDAFRKDVRQLVARVPVTETDVDRQVADLWSLLEKARRRCIIRERAQDELQLEEEQRTASLQSLAAHDRRLHDLMQQAGTATQEELTQFAAAWTELQQIRQKIEQLNGQLHVCARGMALEQFIDLVRKEDAALLAVRLEEVRLSLEQLEHRQKELMDEELRARQVTAEFEKAASEAADHQQVAANHAAQIRRDVSHFLRLQLAIQFLRSQIEEFRQQNQQPLLSRASDLFREFTNGSFDGLGTSFDAADVPILIGRRNGSSVELEGMSEGTRDQLYLALRLAAIELHQQKHEPMPVILDDLLMTFDDQRAAAILPVLSELGRSTQVLLFTHHEHLARLAERCLAEGHVHLHSLVR